MTTENLTTLKTPADVARFEAKAAKEWSAVAKEPITCEVMSDWIYAFGSELACLRLFAALHNPKHEPRVRYSSAKQSWYFAKRHNV